MKTIVILIKDKFLNFSDLIFNKINQGAYFLFKNLITNFSNFLIGIICILIFIFYQSIVEILNFEMFGKQYTFGDSLSNLISLGFEATWNLAIAGIRSFSPNGLIGLAFEVITETIALFMFLLGYVIFFLIYLLKISWRLITEFGFYNIVVILSWSYLIGLYRYIFYRVSSFLQSKKSLKQLSENEEISIKNLESE